MLAELLSGLNGSEIRVVTFIVFDVVLLFCYFDSSSRALHANWCNFGRRYKNKYHLAGWVAPVKKKQHTESTPKDTLRNILQHECTNQTKVQDGPISREK